MKGTELSALQSGSILADRYVIGNIAGEGGFGITYTAFDTQIDRRVAVKEYFPKGAAVRGIDGVTLEPISKRFSEDFSLGIERILKETKILTELRAQTDVINIYDAFAQNGTVYYVMEYIDGLSLDKYISRFGKLNSGQAINAAEKIAYTLEKINAKNIIHRDISPENIIITHSGDVKLVDFGNARPFSFDSGNSLTVALKQGYAPLEQYQRHGDQGPWTDIYSLGAVLYYALTAKDPQPPMNRLQDDMDFQVGLSSAEPEIAAVIKKMTAIKPRERYQSCSELLADIKRIEIEHQDFSKS